MTEDEQSPGKFREKLEWGFYMVKSSQSTSFRTVLALLLCGCVVSTFSACNRVNESEKSISQLREVLGGSDETTILTSASAIPASNGEAVTSFELPSGTNKITVVAQANANLYTNYIANESGEKYLQADGELVAASLLPDSLSSTVTVPSRDFDIPLSGSTLIASAVTDSSSPVTFTLFGKQDPDLTSGSLLVNVNYIGQTVNDPNLKAAMTQAIEIFKTIYSSQAAVTLRVQEFNFDGPAILPEPTVGSDFYTAVSTAVPNPAINICVGFDLPESGLLGESSGIPGSPLPGPKSCVGVSALNGAGVDGSFSAEDVRVLGETLAHEVGHYLGLFHPVEDGYSEFDDLNDTPTCNSEASCDGALGGNNMYFTPIADAAGALVPQQTFSSQQRGVINRYLAVD